ncbi:sulfotransferase family protein [Limnoglobus roseus]|uniref:Sulfotransferase family protein n=1 Tax=Limnoglobus roseus TaxID=2598579 RepID=A0A5C1A5I2_9BACT|nr:hypothetical protein [Limnoglobus roseus]QEL13286.1 hypothetical protein PX52LOC_00140 [Limnoglobus roseus]
MSRKNDRHIIISGTGRAGTTFLMQLLTHLGEETGFTPESIRVDPASNAGLEHHLHDDNAPYIVKTPHICEYLDEFLVNNSGVKIEYAIVPIRALQDAAESRRYNSRDAEGEGKLQVIGGQWGSADPDKQEVVLMEKLYSLLFAIAKHDIPLLMPQYPRLKDDPNYLFEKLRIVFPHLERDNFDSAYKAVYTPNTGYKFKTAAAGERS